MFELFVMLVLLAVVTLVGHGIWVFLALIFHAIFGGGQDVVQQPVREPRETDLQVIRRVLQRLLAQGKIEPHEFAALNKKVEESYAVPLAMRTATERQPDSESEPIGVGRLKPEHQRQPESESEPVGTGRLKPEHQRQPESESEPVGTGRLKPAHQRQPDEEPIIATVCDEPVAQPVHVAAVMQTEPKALASGPGTDNEIQDDRPEASAFGSQIPIVPAAPRRSWGAVIESFLAVHNIRWGELVAGVLIVVCSIGLVISLWSTLVDAHRVIPSLIFLTANAAIFAAGFYTLAKWKLRHTSRAVLLIATLLVPLSVLAGLAISSQSKEAVSLFDPITLIAILCGTGVNVALLLRAGRALFGAAKSRAFALATATPAALIPLIPESLRGFESSAGFLVLAASLAVAAAIVWFQKPWRQSGGSRKLLTAVSRHQWTFMFVAGFSFAALAITLCYMGREFRSDLWYAVIVSCVPAVTVIGVASQSASRRTTIQSHDFIGKVVSVLSGGLVLITLPMLGHDPTWLWLWATVATLCLVGCWQAYRISPLLALATLPVSITALVSSSSVLGQVEWESLSWTRRLVGGEPMLAAGLLAMLALGLLWFYRSGIHKRSLAILAGAWFGYASLNAAVLAVAPESWLGIVPAGVLVVVLVVFTIVSAIAAVVGGLPAIVTVGLSCMVACAAFHPVTFASGGMIAGVTIWMQTLLLAASILGMLCLTFERLHVPAIDKYLIGWGVRVSSPVTSLCTRQWYFALAVLSSLAFAAAALEVRDQPVFAAFVAGIAAVLLLIAGERLAKRDWMFASQLATLVVGCGVVRHYFSDAFYSFPDGQLGDLLAAEPVWNWTILFSLLGGLWIALQVWSNRKWFPLDLSRTPSTNDEETRFKFPTCWFLAVASALLVIGSASEFALLLLHRVDSGAGSVAGPELREWLIPLSGFVLAFAATGLLGRVSGNNSGSLWRNTLALVQVSLVVWLSTRMSRLFPLTDSGQLIVAATVVMAVFCAGRYFLRRWMIGTSRFVDVAGMIVLVTSTASLVFHDWLKDVIAGNTPDMSATIAVTAWWLIVSAGLFVSSLRSKTPGHAVLSAVMAPLACTLLVPVFSDLHQIAWVQFTGLAALVWAMIAYFADKRLRGADESVSPANFAISRAVMLGTLVGVCSAVVGLVSPVISGMVWNSLLNPVSFVLVIATVLIATIRGISEVSSVDPSCRMRFVWPIAITFVAGQLTWLFGRLAPQSNVSLATIEFSLLTIASLASLYRYAQLRQRADAWHILGLSVFGLIAAELTSRISPWFSLTLLAVLGAVATLRWTSTELRQLSEMRTRLLSWFVIAAGVWTTLKFAQPSTEFEQVWTYVVGWSAGWTIVWHLVPLFLNSRVAEVEENSKSHVYWLEFILLSIAISVVEVVAHVAGYIADDLPLQATSLFVVRFLLLQTVATTLWLRGRNWHQLAVGMTLVITWLAATAMHVGVLLEMSASSSLMMMVLATSFVSAMLALSITHITRLHRTGTQWLRLERTTDGSSHSFAALTPLLLSSIVAMVTAFVMYQWDGPLSLVQLTIGGVAICAVGVSELSERLRRVSIQRLSLGLGLLAIYSWASLPTPGQAEPLLCGAMRWLVVSVWLIPAVLWGLPRLAGSSWAARWSGAIRHAAVAVASIGVGSLFTMLALEAMMRLGSGVPELPMSLVIGVAISIGLLSVLSAVIALASGPTLGSSPSVPGAMKLTLADSRRRMLVIAAQVLGVVTWLHVFLCKPYFALFGLREYWPYIVMVIAFVSVGVVEWVRRRGDTVISQTLSQTSLYMPLIPAIGLLISGVWIKPVTGMLSGGPSLSIVLIIAAGYYVLLSKMWEGWMPRVLLVVFANSAVWSLIAKNPEWGFLRHPQLWLIPPAACVLVLAQRYRKEFDAKLIAVARYAATLVIYISSTADMMIQQIGTTLWGPVILILLAFCGMAVGVLLRIRPFLYLGTAFVLLGVTSMVWHAQRSIDQVWPWWAFGITMGVCLLAGLMSIEKNKGKLQELSARLNSWES